MRTLDLDGAKKSVSYDKNTGIFLRVERQGRRKVGIPLGRLDKDGYLTLTIGKKTVRAHRLAWLMTYGQWPSKWLDHIDGNKSNNAISNLREITPSENQHNRSLVSRANNTGLLGVSYDKKRNKFCSCIRLHGKTYSLGRFNTKEEAHEAYKAAKLKLHPTFPHQAAP